MSLALQVTLEEQLCPSPALPALALTSSRYRLHLPATAYLDHGLLAQSESSLISASLYMMLMQLVENPCSSNLCSVLFSSIGNPPHHKQITLVCCGERNLDFQASSL